MVSKKELKEDKNYKDAYDVATKIYKKFRNLVKSIVLFGSTAKHETTKKSDIDLLVDFNKSKSLLELVRIERELFEKTGRKVDLLSHNSISPYIYEKIQKDLHYLAK